MRVYFVNDTSDFANWGCRATTRAVRHMVEQRGGTITHVLGLGRMDTPERFVPSAAGRGFERAAWEMVRRLPIGRRLAREAVARAIFGRLDRLYGACDTVPRSWSEFPRFADEVLRGRILAEERAALEACDFVFINGEGSIYDRQRKGMAMLFVAYLAKEHFGKPCVLVNHTADLHDPVMAEVASAVYPTLDDVTFREPISAEHCRVILPDAADRLAPDAAFNLEPASGPEWSALTGRGGYYSSWPDSADGFDPRRPYVCVGGSSIYLRPDRPAYDPVPAFVRLCERLRAEYGQVVLTAPCVTDERIMRPVARELGLPLIGLCTPTLQAVDIIGNAALLISGRWHASIFAMTGGAPIVVTTANTHKTAGLLRLAGMDSPVFDALRLDQEIEPILALSRDLISQGATLRRTLRQRARELAQASWRNVAALEGAIRALAQRPAHPPRESTDLDADRSPVESGSVG